MESQKCSYCLTTVPLSLRYPKMLCHVCCQKVTDEDGRQVQFFNSTMFGGCEAHYVDNQETYNSHDCYIHSQKFKAEEARFGGIVIQKI